MKITSDPQLKKIVRLAIKEDLGKLGDITSNTVLTKRDRATFHFVSRAKGILHVLTEQSAGLVAEHAESTGK